MPSPLREHTEAALAGAAELDLGRLDPGALLVVLAAIGDALRLGAPLSVELSQNVKRDLTMDHVLAAVEALTASVDAWSLPATVGEGDVDPAVPWALRGRDEVESVLVAARRVLLPRGRLVDTTEQAERLRTAVGRHDLSCSRTLTRARAEALLGDRRELIDARSWLDDVAWADEPADSGGRPFTSDDAANVPPDLRTLEGYVVEGRLGPRVERAAAHSADVAEDLEMMIATYREHGQVVSLTALRWLRARGAATKRAPLVLHAPEVIDRAAAADTSTVEESTAEIPLGLLAPLDVVARLLLGARSVTLRVYPGEVGLREVRLGVSVATVPVVGNTWSVTIPREASELLELRVVDQQGRIFEETITLVTAET